MESAGPRAAAVPASIGAARAAARPILDPRSLALALVTAVAYGIAAGASLLFVPDGYGIAAVWPAAGIALGLILVTERGRWFAVATGTAAGGAAAYLAAGVDEATTAGLVAAHTVEPLVAALLLARLGFASLETLRGVGIFIGCAVLAGPALGAAIGSSTMALASGSAMLPTWVSWVLRDAGGVVAVAPIVLAGHAVRTGVRGRRRLAEAVAMGIGIVLITAIAFLPIPLAVQPSAYTTFLLLVLVAIRFGVVGASLGTLTVAAIATIGTLAGHGPVALLNDEPALRIGQLHVLVAVVFLVSFVTAAAMAERRAAVTAVEAQRTLEADRAAMSSRLTEFAREIARSLDADALFQRIAQAAVEVVPADMARLTVAMGDDDHHHRIVAAVGAPAAIGRPIAAGDGVTGAVIRDGVLVVRDRVTPAERVSTTRDVMPDAPLAVACAPILSAGAVIATLALARLDLGRPFEADEVRSLEMMAELSALALANAVEFGKAQDLSIRDELTGVPNRRYFTTSFEQLAAQRLRLAPEARVPVSAILFDLDHFGPVNKERGHATGDIVLAAFGRLLAARLRRADVVARYGGEEFVAVLVGTERDDAMRVADEIRRTFEVTRLTGADGAPIRCTVSAGIATVAASDASLDGLLPTADVALSMAKRAGRNTVSAA